MILLYLSFDFDTSFRSGDLLPFLYVFLYQKDFILFCFVLFCVFFFGPFVSSYDIFSFIKEKSL